jgi:hypothetical protein
MIIKVLISLRDCVRIHSALPSNRRFPAHSRHSISLNAKRFERIFECGERRFDDGLIVHVPRIRSMNLSYRHSLISEWEFQMLFGQMNAFCIPHLECIMSNRVLASICGASVGVPIECLRDARELKAAVIGVQYAE